MSKLDSIRNILSEVENVNWSEHVVKREHLLREGEFYWVVGLQVSPSKTILDSTGLQGFSEQITESLMPVGPVNITKCYAYAESRRDVVKTAALYFTETIEEPGEENGLERRITVSIYPCRVMADNLGIRATIDLGHYECPEPCVKPGKCAFWSGREGFIHEASR